MIRSQLKLILQLKFLFSIKKWRFSRVIVKRFYLIHYFRSDRGLKNGFGFSSLFFFWKKIQLMAYNYSEGNWKGWWSSYALYIVVKIYIINDIQLLRGKLMGYCITMQTLELWFGWVVMPRQALLANHLQQMEMNGITILKI